MATAQPAVKSAKVIIPETFGTMGTWKAKKIAKKARGSQATGKSKGISSSTLQKYMCRRNRSWKHSLYGEVMDSIGSRKSKK
jgi:hypothetical protein